VRRIANVERLYVMPAGDKALLPRTLLSGTANVRERLDRLARHFDLVLLDSAPVTMSPESFNLVSKVDGVLVVSMAERTRREVLGATRDQLKQAGAQVLGGVLNRRKFHIPHMLYRWLG
jgi:Mrp family chromosome partitioning ATPase